MEDMSYEELVQEIEEIGIELSGSETFSELIKILSEEALHYNDSLDELDFG